MTETMSPIVQFEQLDGDDTVLCCIVKADHKTVATINTLYPEVPHVNALGRIALAVARMSDYVDTYYWRDIADELEAVVDRYVAMRTLRHRVKVVGAD